MEMVYLNIASLSKSEIVYVVFNKTSIVPEQNNHPTLIATPGLLCGLSALQVKDVLSENIGFQNKYGQQKKIKKSF